MAQQYNNTQHTDTLRFTSYDHRPISEAAMEHISTKIVPAIYKKTKSYQIFRDSLERSNTRRYKYTKENKLVKAPSEVTYLSDSSNVERINFNTTVIPIGQLNQKYEIPMEMIIESVNNGFQNIESIFRASSMKHWGENIDKKLLYRYDADKWMDLDLPTYGLSTWPGVSGVTTTTTSSTKYSGGGQYGYNDFLKMIAVYDDLGLDLDGITLKSIMTPAARRALGYMTTYDKPNIELIRNYCKDQNINIEFWSSPFLLGDTIETSGSEATWILIHPEADIRLVEYGGITTATEMNREFTHRSMFDLSYGGMLFVGQPTAVVKMEDIYY